MFIRCTTRRTFLYCKELDNWQWGLERFQIEFLEPAILRIQGSQEELNGKMAVICHYVAS